MFQLENQQLDREERIDSIFEALEQEMKHSIVRVSHLKDGCSSSISKLVSQIVPSVHEEGGIQNPNSNPENKP